MTLAFTHHAVRGVVLGAVLVLAWAYRHPTNTREWLAFAQDAALFGALGWLAAMLVAKAGVAGRAASLAALVIVPAVGMWRMEDAARMASRVRLSSSDAPGAEVPSAPERVAVLAPLPAVDTTPTPAPATVVAPATVSPARMPADMPEIEAAILETRARVSTTARDMAVANYGIDIDSVPAAWMTAPYLGDAGKYPEVGRFWSQYAAYLVVARQRSSGWTEAFLAEELAARGVSASRQQVVRAAMQESIAADGATLGRGQQYAEACRAAHALLVSLDAELGYEASTKQWTYSTDAVKARITPVLRRVDAAEAAMVLARQAAVRTRGRLDSLLRSALAP